MKADFNLGHKEVKKIVIAMILASFVIPANAKLSDPAYCKDGRRAVCIDYDQNGCKQFNCPEGDPLTFLKTLPRKSTQENRTAYKPR